MLEKVDDLLVQAGILREHILPATNYIKNMQYFDEMNEVWENWAPAGHAPARPCVEANMVRDAMLVKISIIAAER